MALMQHQAHYRLYRRQSRVCFFAFFTNRHRFRVIVMALLQRKTPPVSSGVACVARGVRTAGQYHSSYRTLAFLSFFKPTLLSDIDYSWSECLGQCIEQNKPGPAQCQAILRWRICTSRSGAFIAGGVSILL